MKKRFSIILIACVALLMMTGSAFAGDVNILFNDKALKADVEPVIKSGRTLVPLRAICESLGAEVNWDNNTRTITIVKNQKTVKLTLDQKAVYINGQLGQELDVPAQAINGRTMVPVRFVSETLGANVDWNGETRTVSITHSEKRDGMTPQELFMKSNEAMEKVESYKFTAQGTMKTVAMDQTVSGTIEMEGLFKAPMETYFKQTATIKDFNMDIEMEMYMKNEKEMYMKSMGGNWQKIDLTLPDNLLKTDAQDPANTLKQMEEFGLLFSHGDEVVVDDKGYYVMYIRLDEEKFKKMVMDVVAGMDMPGIEIDEEEIMELYRNMRLDIVYKAYIDKETLYMTKMEVNGYSAIKASNFGVEIETKTYTEMVMEMKDFGAQVTMPVINL